MVKRLVTAVIGLPLVILSIYSGGMLLRAALLVVSLRGLYEFYRALSGGKTSYLHWVGDFAAIILFQNISGSCGKSVIMTTIALLILGSAIYTVYNYKKVNITDFLITIGGFFYIPFLFSFIYLVREESLFFAGLIFVSAASSDTFAYAVGRTLGKHKMVNSPSPNKTYEGSIGGFVGAALIGFIYFQLIGDMVPYHSAVNVVIISILGAFAAQLGDLFASAIKRSTNIKDFGRILPGHGGIVDRFDGVIFAAPVIYMVMFI